MFDTMLENAARAAADVGLECGLSAYDGSALWDEVGIFYTDIARAVLMAVREPDAKFHTVGRRAADQADPMRGFASSYGDAFTAMIDAILNEEPSNG